MTNTLLVKGVLKTDHQTHVDENDIIDVILYASVREVIIQLLGELTTAPDPPAWKVRRSQVSFPWVKVSQKVKTKMRISSTNCAPVPGRLLKSIRREVSSFGTMVLLIAESAMEGDCPLLTVD